MKEKALENLGRLQARLAKVRFSKVSKLLKSLKSSLKSDLRSCSKRRTNSCRAAKRATTRLSRCE